jgi:5-methyltetrahydrofolate--homocysteine methyltransferase
VSEKISQPSERALALEQLLSERIVIIDGAMGTMIQLRNLTEADFRGMRFQDWKGKDLRGNNDLLNVTQPQMIEEMHVQYLEAGADIIETNTFNSQAISLADYGLESIAKSWPRRARNAPGRRRIKSKPQPGRTCFVAGAIGPTTKTSRFQPTSTIRPPAAQLMTS